MFVFKESVATLTLVLVFGFLFEMPFRRFVFVL
jgi:hypothetical protein